MRLTIFGATGGTGLELVRQGLAQGHALTCMIRNPATAKLPPKAIRIRGDVYDADDVAKCIEGSDAVLSALGSRSLGKSDLLDRAIANILLGMKENGVRRIIVLGAAGTVPNACQYQNWANKFLLEVIRHTVLKHPFLSQEAQENRLAASDADYTIVRPPRLTNGAYTGRYRVEADGLPRAFKSIARADVADFMLKQLNDPKYIRRGVYVAR